MSGYHHYRSAIARTEEHSDFLKNNSKRGELQTVLNKLQKKQNKGLVLNASKYFASI